MKKSLRLILLAALVAATLFGSLATGAYAATREVSAKALNTLGMMGGVGTNADGSVNFNLSGAADRQTAVTMLVRLLGKEAEATGGTYKTPFSDFDAWAKPYIGYAYNNGLVNGSSATTFGGTGPITAQQYITMLLRALGYSDGEGGDFTYDSACEFAGKLGLTDGTYTNSTKSFKRGDVALISFSALKLKMNASEKTLYATVTGKPDSDVAAAEKSAASAQPPAEDPATLVKNSDGTVIIDWASAAGGVVKVSAAVAGEPILVVRVTSPSGTKNNYYDTEADGTWQSFVLPEGNGTYTVTVLKNIRSNSFTTIHSSKLSVKLSSDTAPFLCANIFVDYTQTTKCVQQAGKLCKNSKKELDKVDSIYYFVVNNFTYDYDKAKTVQDGYRPNLDTVWAAKKGICFDYASTMAAMLRSQGVPTKLVVGYAGTAYHAWINVYTKETGWIEAVIYFDGANWKLMDPTFASSGGSKTQDFINNPANYSAKYVY
ncbi:MAG: transglutaminase-like domain-containing protein [Oscillospiraceae bacterium]